MSDSKFYNTDPDDIDAPRVLAEWRGLRPGSRVVYENPAWRQADGTYKTGGMDGTYTVTELVALDGEGWIADVLAVLDDGAYEVNAANLRAVE